MKKILYYVAMLCIMIVVTCVVYQVNAKETVFEVPASELSEFHVWVFRGYSEVVYNGESYTGDLELFDVYHATLEKVALRKKGFFNDIVSTEYKEIELSYNK